MAQFAIKHGHSCGGTQSKTVKAWLNAKGRCFCKTNKKYPLYGGRGITMDAGWADDFSLFLSDMGECPVGLTLDRINNNGNYEPGNCRWATPEQQTRNRRMTFSVEVNGVQTPLLDAIKLLNVTIGYRTILYRLSKGWPLEKALFAPTQPQRNSLAG